MSNMGAPKDLSFLPEEMEKKLKDVDNYIFNKNKEKTDLETVIGERSAELVSLNTEKNNAVIELDRVTGLYKEKNREMDVRENRLKDEEARLTLWATELGKKEKQVNRYLAIFENMKNVIKAD